MPPTGPLSGILVLDLTRVLAGPYCTMLLSDLGARVIKIERPGVGDDARAIGPFTDSGQSAYFSSLNRGKESIALDLKEPADRQLFERMLGRSDVLVENFRPGAMEKLGYGWEAVHPRFPRLIYAATSGFGHTGPDSARPAYDVVVQARGGIMSLTGEPGRPPARVGTSIGDITAGLFTAAGINAALYDRAQTGLGRKLDVAMLDCQVAILENAIARYRATGDVPGPLGSRHPSITPFGAFASADGYFVIAAGNDELFRALCGELGREDLAANPDFSSNGLRTENQAALTAELERTLAARTTSEWIAALESVGVPCGPIHDIGQVVENPQVLARNMLVETHDPSGRPMDVAGNPIKLSGFEDPQTRDPAPALDAQREALLEEFGAD